MSYCSRILIKCKAPAKGNNRQGRQWQYDKAGCMDEGLNRRHREYAGKGPVYFWPYLKVVANFSGKDGLPEFHPDKKPGDPKCCFNDVFMCNPAAAHIAPEI